MKDEPFDYEPLRPSRSSSVEEADAWTVVGRGAGKRNEAAVRKEPQVSAPGPILAKNFKERAVVIQRGHLLSYLGLFLFTAVVYFRPYEQISALGGLTSMAFWIAIVTLAAFIVTQLSIRGNLTARPREVNLILLLGVAALLSVPFADDSTRAWNAFSDYIKVIIMFVVMINVVHTKFRLQGLLFLALAVSCYLSVHAFMDYSAGIFKSDGYRIVGVIGNMFSNPNDLALHLVTIVPIAVGLMLGSRRFILKILYAACALAMIGTITLTYSRGGFLGLAASTVFLGWRLARRQRVITMAVMFIAISLFIVLAPGGYGNRVAGIVGSQDGSVIARTDDLKRSLWVMARHPLFGVGINNYVLRSTNNIVTHNAYTQIGAEMGIAAMVIYILFIITPFRRLRHIERETVESRRTEARFYYLAVGLQASLVGYMVASFFASVSYLWNVYYLVGYAYCLHWLYTARTDSVTANNADQRVS